MSDTQPDIKMTKEARRILSQFTREALLKFADLAEKEVVGTRENEHPPSTKMTEEGAKEITKKGPPHMGCHEECNERAKWNDAAGFLNGMEQERQAAKGILEAAEKIDKRCLKYGQLPNNQTCQDIESWDNNPAYYCHGCRLEKILAAYKARTEGNK